MVSMEQKANLFEALKNDKYESFSNSISKEVLFATLNDSYEDLLKNPILESKTENIIQYLGESIANLDGGIEKQLAAAQVFKKVIENPEIIEDGKASQKIRQKFYNDLYKSLIDFDHKMVNIDAMNEAMYSFFNIEDKKISANHFKTYISEVQKDSDFLYKLFVSYEKLREENLVNLSDEQKVKFDKISNMIQEIKEKNPTFFNDNLEKNKDLIKNLKFFNSNDIEKNAYRYLKNEELAEADAGVISGDPLNLPLKKTLKNQEERDIYVDIDWEEKYAEFLERSNFKVARFKDKVKESMKTIAPFMDNGFELVGHSIFGNSLVKVDENNNVEYSMLNVSPLTKTMRFTKVGENEPSSYIAAALNARKNGWPSVYLDHPGTKEQAVRFLKQSIQAMVEVGQYDYDDIQVPRKYRYVLEEMKTQQGLISPNKPLNEEYYREENNAPSKEVFEKQKTESDEVEFIDPRANQTVKPENKTQKVESVVDEEVIDNEPTVNENVNNTEKEKPIEINTNTIDELDLMEISDPFPQESNDVKNKEEKAQTGRKQPRKPKNN